MLDKKIPIAELITSLNDLGTKQKIFENFENKQFVRDKIAEFIVLLIGKNLPQQYIDDFNYAQIDLTKVNVSKVNNNTQGLTYLLLAILIAKQRALCWRGIDIKYITKFLNQSMGLFGEETFNRIIKTILDDDKSLCKKGMCVLLKSLWDAKEYSFGYILLAYIAKEYLSVFEQYTLRKEYASRHSYDFTPTTFDDLNGKMLNILYGLIDLAEHSEDDINHIKNTARFILRHVCLKDSLICWSDILTADLRGELYKWIKQQTNQPINPKEFNQDLLPWKVIDYTLSDPAVPDKLEIIDDAINIDKNKAMVLAREISYLNYPVGIQSSINDIANTVTGWRLGDVKKWLQNLESLSISSSNSSTDVLTPKISELCGLLTQLIEKMRKKSKVHNDVRYYSPAKVELDGSHLAFLIKQLNGIHTMFVERFNLVNKFDEKVVEGKKSIKKSFEAILNIPTNEKLRQEIEKAIKDGYHDGLRIHFDEIFELILQCKEIPVKDQNDDIKVLIDLVPKEILDAWEEFTKSIDKLIKTNSQAPQDINEKLKIVAEKSLHSVAKVALLKFEKVVDEKLLGKTPSIANVY